MDAVIFIVRSICMGESEILGNKVEDVSLAFLLPKMYIDCSWKETIPRGMVRLNGSQSLFNILIAWTCFFMFHNNNLGSKWLPWRESWLHQEGYKMLKASPLGDDQEEAFGVEKCVCLEYLAAYGFIDFKEASCVACERPEELATYQPLDFTYWDPTTCYTLW